VRGPTIGFAAALEQFTPREAVRLAVVAERHGFRGTVLPDAFQPFTPTQGRASSAWPVAGAIGAATVGEIGVGPVAPAFRTHPAAVAQAATTLQSMYPGRHWLALGSGEAISDHVVGGYWPEAPERIARLFESITMIRKLFASVSSGRDVRHSGDWGRLESSRLWTDANPTPSILVSTAGPVTARRAGTVADGLLLESVPREKIPLLFQRFGEGAAEFRRDPRGLRVLRLHLSWATTQQQAVDQALTEWPHAGLRFAKSDVRSPFDLAQMSAYVRADDFDERFIISSDIAAHRDNIQHYLDLGFDRILVHNVGRNQEEFLEAFGSDVLPALR